MLYFVCFLRVSIQVCRECSHLNFFGLPYEVSFFLGYSKFEITCLQFSHVQSNSCLKQSVGLLLAILGSEQDIRTVLLPPLMKLGLPSLLINLFTFEMSKLTEERMPERYFFFTFNFWDHTFHV